MAAKPDIVLKWIARTLIAFGVVGLPLDLYVLATGGGAPAFNPNATGTIAALLAAIVSLVSALVAYASWQTTVKERVQPFRLAVFNRRLEALEAFLKAMDDVMYAVHTVVGSSQADDSPISEGDAARAEDKAIEVLFAMGAVPRLIMSNAQVDAFTRFRNGLSSHRTELMYYWKGNAAYLDGDGAKDMEQALDDFARACRADLQIEPLSQSVSELLDAAGSGTKIRTPLPPRGEAGSSTPKRHR